MMMMMMMMTTTTTTPMLIRLVLEKRRAAIYSATVATPKMPDCRETRYKRSPYGEISHCSPCQLNHVKSVELWWLSTTTTDQHGQLQVCTRSRRSHLLNRPLYARTLELSHQSPPFTASFQHRDPRALDTQTFNTFP